METLTELQVMNYCSKLSEHFINNRDNLMNLKILGKFHSILSPSGRLIAIGHHPMTCKSLSNLDLIFNVGLVKEDMLLVKKHCWKFEIYREYDGTGEINNLWRENLNLNSEEELYKFILVNQKVELLDLINFKIDSYRDYYAKVSSLQNHIYILKYNESEKILKNNIKEDTEICYPFTSGYSKIMNIPLQEAARQIKFQHENEISVLSETENSRIHYTNIVRKEKDITKLKSILQSFIKESVIYSVI